AAITGDLRVSATTTGQSLDKNGYTVSLDGEPIYEPYEGPLRLRVPSGSYLVKRLSPGSRTVELRDISSNCTISGANPRTVSVVVGVATEVVFNVACTSSP
ncbi:MAG TPA: hypothetical protein VHJ69_01855, partial [Gemmatimonadales bacterium]|nr:hypothetical protein [Gemmatimonadales bacterium]